MSHKKKVTEAVLAANGANAQSSTGPRTEEGKSMTFHNALRHGILTRKVVLEADEKREYRRVWHFSNDYYHPKRGLEQFLVEEITNTSWKLGITESIEILELSRRQDVRDGIDGVFDGELKLPVSDWDLPVDRGWDCERIIVWALAGDDKRNSNSSRGPGVWQGQVVNAVQNSHNSHHHAGGHLEVHAVLGSSLETMTRYRSALKRDLYRAFKTLRVEQAKRKKGKK